MKRIIRVLFYAIWITSLSACNYQSIEFRKINNARVSIEGDQILVSADALFFNPNQVGGQVREVMIQVNHKEKILAQIKRSDIAVQVKKYSEFQVPIELFISMKELQNEIFGNFLALTKNPEVDLKYSGYFRIKIKGVSKKIPVDYESRLRLL